MAAGVEGAEVSGLIASVVNDLLTVFTDLLDSERYLVYLIFSVD